MISCSEKFSPRLPWLLPRISGRGSSITNRRRWWRCSGSHWHWGGRIAMGVGGEGSVTGRAMRMCRNRWRSGTKNRFVRNFLIGGKEKTSGKLPVFTTFCLKNFLPRSPGVPHRNIPTCQGVECRNCAIGIPIDRKTTNALAVLVQNFGRFKGRYPGLAESRTFQATVIMLPLPRRARVSNSRHQKHEPISRQSRHSVGEVFANMTTGKAHI